MPARVLSLAARSADAHAAAPPRGRKARLTGIRVPVPAEALQARLSGLPAGVLVQPGRIEVRFAKEALTRLYALAQALVNDFEYFEALVGGERTSKDRD